MMVTAMLALPTLIVMVAGLCVLGAVLGFIAFIQLRELTRRVDGLERGLSADRTRVPGPWASESGVRAVPPVAPPAPPPIPEPNGTRPEPVSAASAPPRPSEPVARTSESAPASAGSATGPERAPAPAVNEPPRAPVGAPPGSPSTATRVGTAFSPAARLDVERWLGVRGAAVLGGVVVAIAGFLFLQYSIERGLVTPQVRVFMAAFAGLVGFTAAIPLRTRGYVIVANSITGAGAVLLYAASWAAHVLYGMIGFGTAFAAMVAVTAACGFLAQRHGSLVIAVLGLVGGFATPIALSTGQDRPIALFGYVLLLDLAFLFVAQKNRWPSLGLVALAGTFIMQALWIGARMQPASLAIGLCVLGVFALFFSLFVARLGTAERRRWVVCQVSALLLPFAFAIYFAVDHDLGESLWPIAALAAVLAVAAGWMGRSAELAWLPFGSAAGAVALAFTWSVSHEFEFTDAQAWELVGCGLALVFIHAAFMELAAWKRVAAEVERGSRGAVLTSALGFQVIALFGASRHLALGPWPWIVATILLTLLALRSIARGTAGLAALVSCGLAGTTILVWASRHADKAIVPTPLAWCGSIVLSGGAMLLAAWLLRTRSRLWPSVGVAAFAVPTMCALLALESRTPSDPGFIVVTLLLLGVQVAFAASVARSSALSVVAILSTWIAMAAAWSGGGSAAHASSFGPVFGSILAAAIVFTVWPVARPAVWVDRSNAWRAAALAPLLWFFLVRALFVAHWPDAPILLLPVGFELLAGLAAIRLYAAREQEDRSKRVGRIWFSCTAILFAAMIVPLQVDREPFGLTLALFALGVALLARRIDARQIAWVAMGAAVVSAIALVGFRSTAAFEHSSVRLWNALAYTYLMPAGAVALAAVLIRSRRGGAPGTITGLCAVLFVFAWINLEIANAFTGQENFTLRFEHDPARAFTVSIAWALYALVLLVLGVSKQRGGLRWASLVLLLLTIGKVFLFDLGHLDGLYRAASVFGLGISLLLVSILYQRFVFRRPASTA